MRSLNKASLGDVAQFVRGVTFKPKDIVPRDSPGVVWCMRTKNVQEELDLSDVWGIDAALVKRKDQYLQPGDILVSSANSWNLVGKCSWVPELARESTFGGFVSVLRANRDRVLPRYLYHWFSSPRIQATIRSFGRQTTNISNLDVKRCLKMAMPLPSLEEQEEMAKVLDEADALRVKRRAAIALLDDLAQSIFLDMFGASASGWPVESLGSNADVQGGLQVTSKRKSNPLETPYLRVANVYRNKLDLREIKKLRVTEKELARTRLVAGDLLIVEGHGNAAEIGRVAIWDGSIDSCTHQNHLIRVRLDTSTLLPEYAATLLNSQDGRRFLLNAASTTSGLHTISTSDVRNAPLAIPPIALQQTYRARVQEIRSVRMNHERHLRKLDDLFGSLQQRAFRGELWDD